MKIAVLSGKGGTGKTLVSVNLAAVAGQAAYIDCDVEEPNGYLFFKPTQVTTEEIAVKIPVVDQGLCDGCRKCVEFCNFNALAYINQKLIVFEEMCHSCGGCVLVCPLGAVTEKDKPIGVVERGVSDGVRVMTGIMNPGEASGIPIIKRLLADVPAGLSLIDCPPGSACIVMESVRDSDYCIMVAEPTIFGAHNLALVHELVRLFDKPHGVVLNKCLEGYNPSEQYCLDNGIKVLARIDFDQELGWLNSEARIAVREKTGYRDMFASLLETVREEVRRETAIDPQR